MAHKVIQTDKAPAAIGPYSQGIAAGSWFFVSGQLGMDPDSGELVGSDIASQSRQALENLFPRRGHGERAVYLLGVICPGLDLLHLPGCPLPEPGLYLW